jgi:hypothetical protein
VFLLRVLTVRVGVRSCKTVTCLRHPCYCEEGGYKCMVSVHVSTQRLREIQRGLEALLAEQTADVKMDCLL